MFTALFGIAPPDWFSYGYVPIVICLGLHYYAYSFLLVSGALQTIDSELEEAGALAGLTKAAVLRKITFPIVLPARKTGPWQSSSSVCSDCSWN